LRLKTHGHTIREITVATINVNLPDSLKEFVDRKVGSGSFKDASAYLQILIAEAMEAQEGFTEEQRERIDQMLLESMDSLERGEYAPLRPGEFEDLAKQLVEKHNRRTVRRSTE
jgi:Arc/MetJ-type ribon-helix-helix transcriptional regulator